MKHKNVSIIVLFIMLNFFYSLIAGTVAIYRETIGESFYLNIVGSSTEFTISFNSMGGNEVDSVVRTYNQSIGTLPTPKRLNYNFDGWYTQEEGGNRISSDTLVKRNKTYYAHWNLIVCKVAESLHVDPYASLVYGNFVSSDTLQSGNAYDCNVDGSVDGEGNPTYDPATERFYYLTDDNYGNAVLIYYNNTYGDTVTCGGSAVLYNQEGSGGTQSLNTKGPSYAMTFLPSSSLWNGVELHNQPRQILNHTGGTTTSAGTISTFTYEGHTSRFATSQEIASACNTTIVTSGQSNSQLNACLFLIENTSATGNTNCRSNYWLETPAASAATVFRIDKNGYVGAVGATSKSGVRPVIEVPYENIQLYSDITTTFNVQFESQGGTEFEPRSVQFNHPVGELPIPSQTGFEFIGWYTENVNYDTEVHETDIIRSDVVYYAKWSVNSYVTVHFDANGGSSSFDSKQVMLDGMIGELPDASQGDLIFTGWYTDPSGGTKITESTFINEEITFYAQYSSLICKRATSLHQYSSYTYGQIPVGYELRPGDAFDCNVDGSVDGEGNPTYDADDERFYYLTTEGDYAILIYSNNVGTTVDPANSIDNTGIPMCGDTAIAYGASGNFYSGPTNAYQALPSTTQWPNVSLHSVPRQILNENDTTKVGTYTATTFDYSGKAARFATVQEIKAATTSTLKGTNNELNVPAYYFLIENTSGHLSGCRSNYWLETPVAAGGKAYRLDGSNKKLGSANGSSGIRPVIEVPIELVELDDEPEEFDIIPTAMRTYFNNVSSWDEGQSDSNYSAYNTAMVNNLTANDCVYYQGDNVSTEYGHVYCDQPNQYDTGVAGDVDVYEYDESTRTKTAATYVSADNGKLYNMIPDTIYYWEDHSDSSVHGYVKPIGERRIITINGTNRMTRNVRDLGGLPVDTDGDGTIDGKIKYQKIYRGEKIWGGDDTTKALFEKLGIYNEFDLRTPGTSEIVPSQEDELANRTSFEIVHYKINYDEFGPTQTASLLNGRNYYEAARAAAIDVMQKVVAGNDDYAIFFHCRIGADRTGTLAYILEGLLGVPTEYRYQDYELSVFFGLRERTRYYYNKSDNTYKFIYLKNAIRAATANNTTGVEDVMAWFLLGGNSTPECNDITSLINDFRTKMINYY